MVILMAILWFGWLDTYLYAARTFLVDFMLTRTEGIYYLVLNLLR
jgi:hypothetical protein